MHNKVGIFDAKTICTGSFNWTRAAEKRNDENLLIVDGTQVAAAYEKFVFQRILIKETLVDPLGVTALLGASSAGTAGGGGDVGQGGR